jgi:hypothetical protein
LFQAEYEKRNATVKNGSAIGLLILGALKESAIPDRKPHPLV